MGDIVNLRSARKERARRDRQKQAAENRSRFGATRHAKASEIHRRERANRELDGSRREKPVTE